MVDETRKILNKILEEDRKITAKFTDNWRSGERNFQEAQVRRAQEAEKRKESERLAAQYAALETAIDIQKLVAEAERIKRQRKALEAITVQSGSTFWMSPETEAAIRQDPKPAQCIPGGMVTSRIMSQAEAEDAMQLYGLRRPDPVAIPVAPLNTRRPQVKL